MEQEKEKGKRKGRGENISDRKEPNSLAIETNLEPAAAHHLFTSGRRADDNVGGREEEGLQTGGRRRMIAEKQWKAH